MEVIMAEKVENTTNWPDLAIGLYDHLTGRGAEITYEFDNVEIAVPNNTTDKSVNFLYLVPTVGNIPTSHALRGR
jgi:hypothetical protein